MSFKDDKRKEQIVNALMTKQRKIQIGNVEVYLKPLNRDTKIRQERQAELKAQEILKLI